MDETEQETLELRLETEGFESGPTPRRELLSTQTSCISLAVNDGEVPQEPSQDTSQDTTEYQDVGSSADVSRVSNSTNEDAAFEPSLSASTGSDHRKNVGNCDSSDESRTESPEPPNEHSELNEMDTTFMRSESDALLSSGLQSERNKDNGKTVLCEQREKPQQEESIMSPKCVSGAENDSDQEDDENEELREVMAVTQEEEEEEPAFDKGPDISLPYKEPEQLSLKEFLARRRSKRGSQSQNKEEIGQTVETNDLSASLGFKAPPERKSKLHEEILKAAAKVTPKLSRSNIIATTPVDQLIQKAVSMHCTKSSPSEDKMDKLSSAPGSQLIELKASLKEQINEQRKRSRRERAKRILGETSEEEEEEEEEEDYTTDEEFDDEEALLERAANASDVDEDELEEDPGGSTDIFDDEAHEADDEVQEDAEDEEMKEIDEDSDIEELTERKKSQKNKMRRKNAVQDSDDEEERELDNDGLVESEEDEPNLDLRIQNNDEGEDDDASFMHLSQTQIPPNKQREQKSSLYLDMDNDDAADVDEDLVALCSGRFAVQNASNQEQESSCGEDHDQNSAVADAEEDESEGGGDEGDGCDDEGDGDEDEVNEDEESDRRVNAKIKPVKSGVDFFEGEAELSGSDVGSDGEDENDDMTEAEKKKFLKELIAENPGISEEALHEQVTRLHFKQLLDDDRRDIRLMKEFLLADGDLHSDSAGRERSFKWTNLGNEFVGGHENASDDSEYEEETEEEAKWKSRRLEREKQKRDDFSTGSIPADYRSRSGVQLEEKSDSRYDVSISKIFTEASKSLKIAEPHRIVKGATKKVYSGGFLNMKGDVLQKIAEKVKVNAKEKEGSQTTKNFVFRAVNKPEDSSKVLKRPNSEPGQSMSKRTKVETVKPLPKLSNPKSVFSKF